MLVSGEIENVPLLDVLQVVSYSKQTGVLTVEGGEIEGALVFEEGAVVCGESTSTRPLLARAASERDARARVALRRVGTLAVLTELLGLRAGSFRFQGTKGRLAELANVPLAPFYDDGTLDTGELLLVVATTVDKPPAPREPRDKASERAPAKARSHPRYATLIPVSVALGPSVMEGYLTNLSEGGALFHGDAFPPSDSLCAVRFVLPGGHGQIACRARVAWVRADGTTGRRGAGLAFVEIPPEGRGRLASYLANYQRLADEYRESDQPSAIGAED